MNREFMKKIIEAKILEYEAIKEILPEGLSLKIEGFEKELIRSIYEAMMENNVDNIKKEKKTKKVTVEF